MHYSRIIIFFMSILAIISCTSQNSNIVVAEYGDNKIYLDEFENAYLRNSGGLEKAKKDSLDAYKNFLDLYINYKMKLRDAEIRGYKSEPEFQKELHDYKINIGSTLYLNNELYNPGIKKLFDRRKTEYRASHIYLIPDSTMDVAQVKDLGKNLIQQIQNGEDFAALAKKYSKDVYTKDTGGDVYYFTAGNVNSAAIEDAVYSTEPGNIYPELISSGAGYHIIKVTDKLPRRIVVLQHILTTFSDSTGTPDTAKALKTMQEIEQKIKAGEDFGVLAAKYSMDKGSAAQRGMLGQIKRGQTVREFDEAAFKLKTGEVSPIVKTQFGFNIIKMVGEGEQPSFDQEKDELRDMYQRIHYKIDYDKLIDKLKKEFNYIQTGDAFTKILTATDTLKVNESYWKSNLKNQIGSDEIFKVNGISYPCDSLFTFMIKRSIYTNTKLDSRLLQDAVNQYSGDVLVRQKALVYDKEDKEFQKLLSDYENGMYLFKILEEEVWSKISVDSVKVFDFWNKSKDKFRWKDRVEFKEIYTRDDSTMNKCYALAEAGTNFDTLYAKFNQRIGYDKTPGYHGLVDKDYNELAKQTSGLKNIGDISKPFKFDNGWSLVKLIQRDNARLKTYEEAKAEAASQYQELESKQLEEEYMNRLRKLYKPKLYYDELRQAFKQ